MAPDDYRGALEKAIADMSGSARSAAALTIVLRADADDHYVVAARRPEPTILLV